MSTTTATHLLPHPTPVNQKSILNILNTKCNDSFQKSKEAHAVILRTGHLSDNYVAGTLIKCYLNPQFESWSYALKVFDELPKPNVFVYNYIMKGCLDNNEALKAVELYCRMVTDNAKPNKFTYPSVFKACAAAGCLEEGRQVHGHVVKLGLHGEVHIKSAGIQMYTQIGNMDSGLTMLKEEVGKADVVCWNVMLDGYFRYKNSESATALFKEMEDRSVASWNTMITGYAKCGQLELARHCFDEMSVRDEISWTAMIDGYVQNQWFKEALVVFGQMQSDGVHLGKHVLPSVLTACAGLGALDQGKWIHKYAKRKNFKLESVLGTSLIDMYAKCGCLDMSWEVFKNMKYKELHSWNAMIGGLAIHGRGHDCIELLNKMSKEEKLIKPDKITMIAVLQGCAHTGLVNQGLKIFDSMKEAYDIKPEVEHYGCVVDLLGRAGMLHKAEEVINSMPVKPNAAVLGALLGACRIHKNPKLGEEIGKLLIQIEPDNTGRYSLLSNIYAKGGKWEEVTELRKLMKSKGLKTNAGKSVIDCKGTKHEFIIGDTSHIQKKEIYTNLEEIIARLRLEGYSPDTSEVLFEVEEEEKETTLMYHSEKLAMAFGIMNLEGGEVIRIFKNLRMCEDCHKVMKIVSRVYERELIVRDRVRFHHFSNGVCSCEDYW